MWTTLRHDVETKKQLVAVALIALFVSVYEVVLFYTIIVPRIRDAMQWIMKSDPLPLPRVG